MADHLEITAEAMDQWLTALQRKVDKIKTDEEYYKSATELLDITSAFIVLLHSFGDILDEESIDICIIRTVTILSLVKSHLISRKVFEEASKEVKKRRLSDIKNIRTKALEEVVYIIREHDLPNIP